MFSDHRYETQLLKTAKKVTSNNSHYLLNLKSRGSEILTHGRARRPLSSRDFISRYLLTVWPLEGPVGRNLTPNISSYVGGRAEIFSPSCRTRPPLAIPPGFSRVQGPPWDLGSPKIFLKKVPWLFSWDDKVLQICTSIESRPLYVPWKFQKNLTTRFREN